MNAATLYPLEIARDLDVPYVYYIAIESERPRKQMSVKLSQGRYVGLRLAEGLLMEHLSPLIDALQLIGSHSRTHNDVHTVFDCIT